MDASATARGKIDRNINDPANHGFAIFETMARDAVAFDVDLFPASLIDSAHVFTDGDNVCTRDDLGPHLAGLAQLDQRFDRGELAIQVEALADFIDEAVAAGPAEQGAALAEDLGGEPGDLLRQAAAVDRLGGQADQAAFMDLEAARRRVRQHLQQRHGDRHDLNSDALAEENADVVDPRRIVARAGHVQGLRQPRLDRFGEAFQCVGGRVHQALKHWRRTSSWRRIGRPADSQSGPAESCPWHCAGPMARG